MGVEGTLRVQFDWQVELLRLKWWPEGGTSVPVRMTTEVDVSQVVGRGARGEGRAGGGGGYPRPRGGKGEKGV